MNTEKIFIEGLLYPAMELLKGNRVRKYTKEIIERCALSLDQRKQIQAEKLKKLLLHCVKNVPAYKSLLSEAEILNDPYAALASLPVLDKEHFRSRQDEYISQTADRANLISNISGGSTGEAVRFYMDRITVEHYEAARFAGMSQYGITYGSRSVMIWGNPIELDAAKQKRYFNREKYLKNRILIPAYALSPDKMPYYVSLLNKYKPEYLYGYSSSLCAFAEMMTEQKLEFNFRLKAVISTAEMLFDYQRESMLHAFNCNIVNEYGARDGGILAYECKDGKMHTFMENTVIETVDPITKSVKNLGENGSALITDLNNYSQPRLRYEINDMMTLSEESCACGKSSLIISELSGRQDALLVGADGTLVHGHAISHMARKYDLMKYMVVQISREKCILYAVSGKNSGESLSAFANDVSSALGGVPVNVQEVNSLPVSKSGKHRYTVREFKL